MFTESYLPIMPDFLPFHWELILISGVLEFLFGIGVIFEKYRNIALSGIIIILILIFHFKAVSFTLWVIIACNAIFSYYVFDLCKRT